MGVAHVFHAVCDNVAAGQRVEHAVVSHCNAVIDGDGVEFGCIATKAFYLGLHDLAGLMEVGMARDKLGERIDDGNNRLAKLFTFHTVCYP